jgi:hypothetical protein
MAEKIFDRETLWRLYEAAMKWNPPTVNPLAQPNAQGGTSPVIDMLKQRAQQKVQPTGLV